MREEEIRPSDFLEEYLRLSKEDVETFFPRKSHRQDRPCPACGGASHASAFQKNGFDLVTCVDCATLFVNPAPSEDLLSEFYRDSPSQRYWSDVFFPAVSEARREKIFRPRAMRINDLMRDLGVAITSTTDVGAGTGLFADECSAIGFGGDLSVIEPNRSMAATLRDRDYRVFEGFSGEALADPAWASSAGLVTSFEVIEHVVSPHTFISELAKLAEPGGYILFTGPCGTGFDVLLLQEHSNTVFPPHHLNFISRHGVELLVKRCGLELVSFLTPGELDVELVEKKFKQDPSIINDLFVAHVLESGDPDVLAGLQDFLSENGLSSHMWVVARKPLADG